MKALRLTLAIPAGLLANAAIAHLILMHAPARIAIDLVQPIAVVTNWNALGGALFAVLAATLAPGAAVYLRTLRYGTPASGMESLATVALLAAFGLACGLIAPVIFSSDVYAYAAYGELARLGANPYAHALLPAGNAIFDAAIVQWGNPPPTCVYGPPFVWIAAAIVAIAAPLGTAGALDGLRLLSSGALVLCALFAYVAYPGDRSQKLTASATIGLNPVALWCAAEGHNDAFALAVVLAGLACVRRGMPTLGAFVTALSGTIKLPGIAAAFPSAFDRRTRLGAIGGILVALVASVPIFESVAVHLAPHAQYAPQASLQSAVASATAALGPGASAAAAWTISAILAAILAARAAGMLRRSDVEGWTYLAAAGWLLVPNPYPWYGVWLAAIAAIAPGTRGARALLWLSLLCVLRYLPDAAATPSAPGAIALGVAAAVPVLLLLWPAPRSVIINGPT